MGQAPARVPAPTATKTPPGGKPAAPRRPRWGLRAYAALLALVILALLGWIIIPALVQSGHPWLDAALSRVQALVDLARGQPIYTAALLAIVVLLPLVLALPRQGTGLELASGPAMGAAPVTGPFIAIGEITSPGLVATAKATGPLAFMSIPTPPPIPEASPAPAAAPAVARARSPRVFISHSSQDLEFVARLAQDLDRALDDPAAVWYDARGLRGADEWWPLILKELTDRPIFVVVLSPAALASAWVHSEMRIAWNQRHGPAGKVIVPVLYQPCPLPEDLKIIQAIDFVKHGYDDAFAELLATVREGRERQQALDARTAGRAFPGVLPRAANLVGRGRELVQLLDLLRSGRAVGVCAVEGLAGVGKTALAAEAVARLAQDTQTFPGGVAWVSCEGLEGAEGLAELWARVAREIRAEQVAALPDPADRRRALRATLDDPGRPCALLALDNVEPGLDAGAVLDTLAGGQAALLLTSRGAIAPGRLQALPLAPLLEDPAEQLFAQRLRQADPHRPTPEDAGAIPAVAQLLGGLPLAIELTAAYAGVQRQTLAALAGELREVGMAGGPLRGLRLRIDRSWQALDTAQRLLFAGLSLLEGASFPRAAALAMAGAAVAAAAGESGGAASDADAGEPDERAALALDALVSLALVEPLAEGRLRLHPLLREYASERLKRLPDAVADRLGEAMAAYWLEYARAHPDYEGMDALEAESAGLMGAVSWAHEHDLHRELLALVQELRHFWYVRGHTDNRRAAFQWSVGAAETLDDLAELGSMLHGLAVLNADTGNMAEARAGYERALALARQLGDPRAERVEVHGLAVLDWRAGRVEQARAGYERALALARQLGDPAAERAEVHGLAVLDADAGRVEQARVGYERALALARQLGDPAAQSVELQSLGAEDARGGDLARARAELTEALELARLVQQPASIVEAVWWLAELEMQEGHREAACAGFREALALYERLSHPDAEITRERLRALGCEPS